MNVDEARIILWTTLAAVQVSNLVHGTTANAGIEGPDHRARV